MSLYPFIVISATGGPKSPIDEPYIADTAVYRSAISSFIGRTFGTFKKVRMRDKD